MNYRIAALLLLLFRVCAAAAQPACLIGDEPGTGELVYDDAGIDSMLHLSGYRAFFVGESHTGDFEPKFKYCFIRQLNARYGVRDVFMEIGSAAAWFYNRYLETGDSSWLADRRLVYRGGHYPDFWARLYRYNRSLPDSLKIRIHGVDFERTEIFDLLEQARDTAQPVPASLAETWQKIRALAADKQLSWKDARFEKELEDMRKQLSFYEAEFRLLYGAAFGTVAQAILNPVPATTSVNPRNKAWSARMQQILAAQQTDRLVCFFGAAHTRYGNRTAPTSVLNGTPAFKGKVLHIATLYRHFSSLGPNTGAVEYNPGEQELFDKFYDKHCRAVIVPSHRLAGATFRSESDYMILATEIADP